MPSFASAREFEALDNLTVGLVFEYGFEIEPADPFVGAPADRVVVDWIELEYAEIGLGRCPAELFRQIVGTEALVFAHLRAADELQEALDLGTEEP
jgi:hypothetical protein